MNIGDRVRLTGPLVNPDSKSMPVEKGMDAGLEGTIVHLTRQNENDTVSHIKVNWDNGRSLGLFPSDPFVVITKETAPGL
jgi:hypothetical protein